MMKSQRVAEVHKIYHLGTAHSALYLSPGAGPEIFRVGWVGLGHASCHAHAD